MIGAVLVDLVNANGIPNYSPTPYVKPPSNPPTISISLPANTTLGGTHIVLDFTVTIPAEANTEIATVFYNLDGSKNYLKDGGIGTGQSSMRFRQTLIGLSEGKHSIIVYASCESYTKFVRVESFAGVAYDMAFSDVVWGHSGEIQFGVNVLPLRVAILLLENETYDNGEVPLDFTVSEAVSWMGYSLDEQPTVTVAGNTTLTGLSPGTHEVMVYANDTVGSQGQSEMIRFNVAGETVNQGTETESVPTSLVATASVVIAAVVSIGLLFYFKRKGRAP